MIGSFSKQILIMTDRCVALFSQARLASICAFFVLLSFVCTVIVYGLLCKQFFVSQFFFLKIARISLEIVDQKRAFALISLIDYTV